LLSCTGEFHSKRSNWACAKKKVEKLKPIWLCFHWMTLSFFVLQTQKSSNDNAGEIYQQFCQLLERVETRLCFPQWT
jgi:hypothetical protein